MSIATPTRQTALPWPASLATTTLPVDAVPGRLTGQVAQVVGSEVEVRGLRLRVGQAVTIHAADPAGGTSARPAEVVALSPSGARALLFGSTDGIARGDAVAVRAGDLGCLAGPGLIGRTIDALGRPIDGGPPLLAGVAGLEHVALDLDAPAPLSRRRIDTQLSTGVRVIDGLVPLGEGQRIGIFAGSGTGKSTLLGMCARGTVADVNVVALIGERGREVREFLEDDLGHEGCARTVMVVATSDEPPLLRRRAAMLATRIAEHFADAGQRVLLMMDSLTRLAMAQREIGLAAGEPPTARGYTPSVFALLPQLLERAGTRAAGSITAIYTILTEGSSLDDDPIADTARSILDGHVLLDRDLLHLGRVPPVDPLGSLSRLSGKVLSAEQAGHADAVRGLLAAVEEVRDLVEVGAYVAGTNPRADIGLDLDEHLRDLLAQDRSEVAGLTDTWNRFGLLAQQAAARARQARDGGGA